MFYVLLGPPSQWDWYSCAPNYKLVLSSVGLYAAAFSALHATACHDGVAGREITTWNIIEVEDSWTEVYTPYLLTRSTWIIS
jgi:hypothetical protein